VAEGFSLPSLYLIPKGFRYAENSTLNGRVTIPSVTESFGLENKIREKESSQHRDE